LEAKELATAHTAAVWAARKWYADQPSIRERLDVLLRDLYRTCGWRARLAGPLAGRYVLRKLRQEDARLQAGWTYEPPTFYEKANQPDATLSSTPKPSMRGRWIAPLTPATG
jgi:hypothetical protein